ncbi:DUF5635 domain-containing protein [Corynebacterium lowii]|uniref:Divergent AAA domain protein n=1 Tax=Corynebacterium lowii TaxID=1544413 RepID=A0A0N8W0M2_9CORY|nr:DUF5635 domain-containing protein [Corynebacterium lowii]KQB87090.1 Divergent AAA domain protein [Corynebacterium lowii]MDP9852325.1 ATP-dependent DNA helicase RecG [Corynebacterium lowii]
MTQPRSTSLRSSLEQQVAALLSTASHGRLHRTTETQAVDFKEEAGRRNREGTIEPGHPTNPIAATKLADEVACMANSPGGGALIVGVEDRTGQIIGTELSIDWLRQRIYSAITIAPDIVEASVEGLRLLIIYVAEAREPVENTGGQLRWRVGDSCKPVDRAQWWQHRDAAAHTDPMAQAIDLGVKDARPGALSIARRWLERDGVVSTDTELLRRIGALRSDDCLTHAGALLFCSLGRPGLEITAFDVPGGSVINRVVPPPEFSLLEQLDLVERSLEALNTFITLRTGFHHEHLRRIPEQSIREALLNGIIHRDWYRSEPTDVRWTELDSSLTVRSPGAFPGAMNQSNILSNREARYPALADLFRAIGLVDKQGVGVDRMYRDMIVLGHRPPSITQVEGPYVECILRGGQPVFPVLDCVHAIMPVQRQQDYRVAIILNALLHDPFITEDSLAQALQSDREAALTALEIARQSTVHTRPLIQRHKNVWILGSTARNLVKSAYDPESAYPLIAYLSTEQEHQSAAVQAWLAVDDSITTGDLAMLTGSARNTAKRTLDALVEQGVLQARGAGRSSRYEKIRH